MCKCKKYPVIMVSIVVLLGVAVLSVCAIRPAREEPERIAPEETLYREHLDSLLQDTGLRYRHKERNGFVYYEIYDGCGRLDGFVLLGVEEGYAGPIKLFVQTSPQGVIQRVYVWEHRETPVYVPDAELERFLGTFTDYSIDTELKWQTDVHGLTGATVTVTAIIKAVHEVGMQAKAAGIFEE